MDIVDPAIERYLHELANPSDPVLREMELQAAAEEFPIIGPLVGRLLRVLTLSIGARRVVELGSGFGYSAYWFARAVGEEGRVILTEYSQERADQAREFLRRGGLLDRTEIHVGDALSIAGSIEGDFDIVFNDIDKQHYPRVLDIAEALLRPGGMLISDNMLWFGTVLDEDPREDTTRGVRGLTELLHRSPEFETVLLPIRDGVTVSLRRGRGA